MITLIDNYDSFTYNLVHYIGELGVACRVVRNDKVSVAEVLKEKPEAIILSPGPCTPNEAGICLDLVEECAGVVPLLGVCLGHQTIGQVFGGKVVRAPHLMHGKTSPIFHEGAGVFEGLPSPFTATRYHSLLVEKESLPACLAVTATSEDGLIMGLQHKEHALYGVQFHPESIASDYGHHILGRFLTLAGISFDKDLLALKRPVEASV